MKALSWEEEDAGMGRMTYYWRGKGKGTNIFAAIKCPMLLHSAGVHKEGRKLLPPNSTPGLWPTSLNSGYEKNSEKYRNSKISRKKSGLFFKDWLPSPPG